MSYVVVADVAVVCRLLIWLINNTFMAQTHAQFRTHYNELTQTRRMLACVRVSEFTHTHSFVWPCPCLSISSFDMQILRLDNKVAPDF